VRSPGAARGQTDLEVFVEKLLNRSDPEAMDPEAMECLRNLMPRNRVPLSEGEKLISL
jgi:hypothetical protein